MNNELDEVKRFLNEFNMKPGKNKTINNKLLKQLNRKNLVSRSMRCIYLIDNFIIKTSSDATTFRLPVGADQCINEYDIFNSTDERLQEYKEIFCPVYAIYESKFLYLTVHKSLTALSTNNYCDETIYTYIESGNTFPNQERFLSILEKFKRTWVTDVPELQNEYSKISSFGYDENKNLYVLDYGML